MAPVGMKGFYRQKKKEGVSKPSLNSKKRSAKLAAAAATPTASPDLQEHGEEAEEERLRQFDLDMKYGPCLGLSRMERWDRACSMGLNPPADVEALLLRSDAKNPTIECLWEGRV